LKEKGYTIDHISFLNKGIEDTDVLRLNNLEKSRVIENVINGQSLKLPGNFTVITKKQVRIRKLIL